MYKLGKMATDGRRSSNISVAAKSRCAPIAAARFERRFTFRVSRLRSDPRMPDFQVFIDDDRYSVPSLYLITANSEARARAKAEELLRASDHHLGIELRQDGERIFALGSFALLATPCGGALDEQGL
jgi:hypothetical protein